MKMKLMRVVLAGCAFGLLLIAGCGGSGAADSGSGDAAARNAASSSRGAAVC